MQAYEPFATIMTPGCTSMLVRLIQKNLNADVLTRWAAFGGLAVLHPDFGNLSDELALADSITIDGHKWLNVPYDCGLFFSRSNELYEVLGPGANAPAYLASSSSSLADEASDDQLAVHRNVPSSLFISIENSKRFRALPVYASLVSLGRKGYTELVVRNIEFARKVESFLRSRPEYEVVTLTEGSITSSSTREKFRIMNIVLFRPSANAPIQFRGEDGVTKLKEAINDTKRMYVTPTVWKGRRAIRLAVSNWRTRLDVDFDIVTAILDQVMKV